MNAPAYDADPSSPVVYFAAPSTIDAAVLARLRDKQVQAAKLPELEAVRPTLEESA